jgi:DNA replication protein DnaC
MKSPQDEDLHDLIDERYEQHSTIITSNLDFPEWGDVFPNKLLGATTLDRLLHNAYRLILEGESYRKLKPESSSKTKQTGLGSKSSR